MFKFKQLAKGRRSEDDFYSQFSVIIHRETGFAIYCTFDSSFIALNDNVDAWK